jgi:cellulose synthase/poly-beta-1,6-N-acetylglucosamine synthase-like glycosyltransferase
MVLKNIILNILIIFFVILIFSQFITLFNKDYLIEGNRNRKSKPKQKSEPKKKSESSPKSKVSKGKVLKPKIKNKKNTNTDILSQKNEANIEYLKDRMSELNKMDGRINNIQQNVDLMQVQIDGLVQQQANFATDLAGDTPPTITGI